MSDHVFTLDDPTKIAGFIRSVAPLCHLTSLDLTRVKRLRVAPPPWLPLDCREGPHRLSNQLQFVAVGNTFDEVDALYVCRHEQHSAHTTSTMVRQQGKGVERVSNGATIMGGGHGLDDFLTNLVGPSTAWLAAQVYGQELEGEVLTLYRSRDTSPILGYPEVKVWFDLSQTQIEYGAFCETLPLPPRT